jgi:hypothetical protein
MPYPLPSFHALEGRAAIEVLHHVKVPDAMVGIAVLKAMTLACQGLIDVRLPSGSVRPVSVNTVLIGESGDRKSEVEDLILKPVCDIDESRLTNYGRDLPIHDSALQIWKQKEAALCGLLRKAVRNGEPTDDIEQKLKAHATLMPIAPRERQFIRSDLTGISVLEALQGDGESLLITSDEGHVILTSALFRRIGLLNTVFGGGKISIDRANHQRLIARNPRASIGLVLQLAVLMKYFQDHGDLARGSGHWARYLFGWPVSLIGTRFDYGKDPVWDQLPAFHARITELLTEYDNKIQTGRVERVVVEFSDEAVIRWREMVNTTETMLQPLGYLSDIKDFASKAMEITSRIAATMHWFSRQEGKISVDTLQRALNIVEWHLHEYKRIFSPQYQVNQVHQDASAVISYLKTNFFDRGYAAVPKNSVLHSGPVRPKARLNDALDLLAVEQKIWIGTDPKRKSYINVGANYGR